MLDYALLRNEIETGRVRNFHDLLVNVGLLQLSDDLNMPLEALQECLDAPLEFTAGSLLRLGRLLDMNKGVLAEKIFAKH